MNISDLDKQALINGSALIPFKINIIQDGVIVKTLDENSIVDLNYEDFRYVDTESLVIGQFVARKVTGNLDQLYSEFEIEDTELNLQMGISDGESTNYYDLGNFLVTKPTTDDVKDKTSFEALDYTKKFNTIFDGEQLTYPCTAQELAIECCRQAGVELSTTTFTNYDFEIPNNQYVEADTCRKVMQDIGKLAYSWIRVDCDNTVYIDFEYGKTVDTYNTIDTSHYYDLSLQKKVFGPVNRVVVGMQDVEGENAVIEDSASIEEFGVTEIKVYDSNITYTPELRQAAIAAASKLFGLVYTPLEINTTGHPWLFGNEKIEIQDGDGNSLYTYPFDRTIAYNGHIKTKLTSKADTKTETEYKNYGDVESSVRKTRIVVDKQNQKITSLAQEVGQYDSRISTVEQTVDRIEQAVELIEDLKRNVVGYRKVHFENAIPDVPLKLCIRNAHLLFPATDIYPKTTLFPLGSYLVVDNQEELSSNAKFYRLPFTALYAIQDTYDEFIIEGRHAYIIHRIGIDSNNELYILDNEYIEELGEMEIIFEDGDNYVYLYSFQNEPVYYEIDYLVHSSFTDRFATEAYVRSSIEQTAAEINLEIDQKTDTDELISKINLKPGHILLEGTVTANENFKILPDGSIEAKNGSFNGNVYLGNGNAVIGGKGLLTNLQFNSDGILKGWDRLGFVHYYTMDDESPKVSYQSVMIEYFIPNGFTVESAYISLDTTPINGYYMASQSASNWTKTTGKPKQLKLYKGDGDNSVIVESTVGGGLNTWNEYYGTEISNAFGVASYTPPNTQIGKVDRITTINLKSSIVVGELGQLFITTSMAKPSATQSDMEKIVAENTGVGKATLYVYGYMSFEESEGTSNE